jgi:hypothetical protein
LRQALVFLRDEVPGLELDQGRLGRLVVMMSSRSARAISSRWGWPPLSLLIG